MRQNICHPQKWPTLIQDLKMAKLAILTWRYLYLQNLVYAEAGDMHFFETMSYE